MINKIYIENYSTFENKIELDLQADNRFKLFPDNILNSKVLKSVVIYGPNNTGKTAFINGMKVIKNILQNKSRLVAPNVFSKKDISKFGIVFISNNKTYKYEFWGKMDDCIVYEYFCEIKNEREELIILKDTIQKKYKCSKKNKVLETAIQNSSSNNIVIYTLNTDNFSDLKNMKTILLDIASRIEIISMDDLTLDKTIDLLKNKDNIAPKVVNFIRNADLFLDDYSYDETGNVFVKKYLQLNKEIKDEHFLDEIKMVSTYKGVKVPSIIFDSLGTKKFASLASYIIEALEKGKILFVDELDSSLHFKLTRAIVALFNNELNKKAQIVCTLHDISLLDCKRLFRKDQIWFTDKSEEGSKLFSLKDFVYKETGIRETSDIIEKYSKGFLGAIPEPDLIQILLENQE